MSNEEAKDIKEISELKKTLEKAKKELDLYIDKFNLDLEEVDGAEDEEIRVLMDGMLWVENMKLK